MRCPSCGTPLEASEMKYHTCGTDPGSDEARDCLGCGTGLTSIGTYDFRFGGMTGGVKLILGEWAELDEEKLRLEVLFCPACRRVEFRLDD
jgi:uncharacterized protein YbaR (Trm112 family)